MVTSSEIKWVSFSFAISSQRTVATIIYTIERIKDKRQKR